MAYLYKTAVLPKSNLSQKCLRIISKTGEQMKNSPKIGEIRSPVKTDARFSDLEPGNEFLEHTNHQ